jgi:hypothetical protein
MKTYVTEAGMVTSNHDIAAPLIEVTNPAESSNLNLVTVEGHPRLEGT